MNKKLNLNFFNRKSILITGGTGSLGSKLVNFFLSKHISTFLEVEHPISSSYELEVSSGGMARPLTTIEDFILFKNNKVKVVLKEKFLGKKTYNGFIGGVDKNGKILLETEDHEINFNFLEIEKANIDPNWAIKNNQVN